MFRGISKDEALWELLMLADELKDLYVHGKTLSDVQFEDMLRRLVKITSRVGGPAGMNFVFGGEVGRIYSKNFIIRWIEKMVDRYLAYEVEVEDENT
jgi:hypothetical protein